jgi:hypothetical protein
LIDALVRVDLPASKMAEGPVNGARRAPLAIKGRGWMLRRPIYSAAHEA